MDRCPVCGRILWPWTGIVMYDKEPHHKACWMIHSMFDRIQDLWLKRIFGDDE